MQILASSQNDYNTVEPTELLLDSNHPGFQDSCYINRRTQFFDRCRDYRLNQKGLPKFDYTEEEHDIWRMVLGKLTDAHDKSASHIYLTGKKLLGIETARIPDLNRLNESLQQQHNMGLVSAEGLIDVKNFFAYLSQRKMPCTQFLRHGKRPEYTPEPDAVHDVIGHIPPLMNKEYVNLIQLIGQGVATATNEQLQAWQRIYWFTIEFGLIEEENQLKVLGAGLLSSYGEMEYCFSTDVEHRPFVLDEVINQTYNSNIMQKCLFVIPSLAFLYEQVRVLINRFSN